VTQFVQSNGPGVQHIAFRVKELSSAISALESRGMEFWTPRLDSDGLSQIFSRRDPATGLMLEFVERRDFDGFRDENVHRLFESLEKQSAY
jgi:methylmalonyl-CoA/ethylmalonyl-CoA epimerase